MSRRTNMGSNTLDKTVQTILQLSIIGVGVTFCVLLAQHMVRKDEILTMQQAHERARRQVEPTSSDGGAVYIRWGRTNCPNTNTDLVYKGYAGGGLYSHPGGGSNYVCLTEDPMWGTYNDANNNRALMYGAEYELSDTYDNNPNFPFTNERVTLNDKEVPCAVCHSRVRAAKVMIPATNVCPAGWTEEYEGYLMAGNQHHAGQKDFICMDAHPVPADCGGSDNLNGALFYPVEAECGSLPCGPYVQDRELTCVVCTR